MSMATSSQYYINIKIDGSTRENYIAYYESMLKSGWVLDNYTADDIEKFKQGVDFRNSCAFDKGSYQVTIGYSINELGQAQIIWWK